MANNKFVTNKHFKIWFLILSELILGTALKLDHSLTWVGIFVVCLFWAVLAHMFIEWLKFEDEFEELKESKSHTEQILNEFAESNLLTGKMAGSIRNDLEFDKSIKLSKDHKPFHLFLSELKYDYLTNYFHYNSDQNNPTVSKIPRFYFEKYIRQDGKEYSVWRWLIEKSKSYKSIAVLNNDTSTKYIDNKERLQIETNFLKNEFSNTKSKLIIINKLFVIKDNWINNANGEISDTNVKEYLEVWKNALNSLNKTQQKFLQIKYIKMSEAKGAIDGQRVEDIGLFDGILGIQNNIDTTHSLIKDEADISFHFNKSYVEAYINKFDTIFRSAKPLI